MTNSIFIGEPLGPIFPEVDMPIFGYKVIMMRWNDGKPVIVPPHYFHNETEFMATAHCRKREHKDEASFQACSCGFYSYHSVSGAARHLLSFDGSDNCFVIQVALSGTVIDAENGMKSSKQRVRQIVVPPCFLCGKTSDAFVEHASGYLVSACRGCIEAGRLKTIEFAEFQDASQVKGFNPIALLPVPNKSIRTLHEAFDHVDSKEKIAQGLRELLAAGDYSGLINVKLQLDEIVAAEIARENEAGLA